jgi:hypothetical protein
MREGFLDLAVCLALLRLLKMEKVRVPFTLDGGASLVSG